MLYSKARQFIFIHVYKAGGTSITESLLPHCFEWYRPLLGRVLGRQVFDRKLAQPCFKHATAREIRSALGAEIYDNAFTFAFVRNPWDLQVSLYKYLCRWERGPHYRRIRGMSDFDEYIRWQMARGIRQQSDFITNAQGQVIVDFVGRFESLSVDFERVARRIGVRARLVKLNVSDRMHYRQYYSSETAALVRQVYDEDVRRFGYEF